ncbi:sensor domain-containing diguanylate cyclase [Chitinimonas sp.]|uniref:GGDEF domain-containing protein n=1 Tax=Chitinimonas sp. TaxID=1934313 RepID=UPI002F95BD10
MDAQMPFPTPRPTNERQRLDALYRYPLLDTAAEAEFDQLTELAAELCDTPYGWIALVDAERVWYKATHGFTLAQSPRDDSICAWTIQEDLLLHLPDLTEDARTAALSSTVDAPYLRMYAGANLISAEGYRLGTLCVADTQARELSVRQQQQLIKLAGQVVVVMSLRQRERELEQALKQGQQLAREDALSGLYNQPALLEQLNHEHLLSSRFHAPISLIMLDLDHFEHVNHTLGRSMGDAVIRGMGSILQDQVRRTDIAGRYGDEAFCLVLPNTDEAGAARLAEALRGTIEATRFAEAGREARITASFGLTTSWAGREGVEALLHHANAALDQAKSQGRNRLVQFN